METQGHGNESMQVDHNANFDNFCDDNFGQTMTIDPSNSHSGGFEDNYGTATASSGVSGTINIVSQYKTVNFRQFAQWFQ